MINNIKKLLNDEVILYCIKYNNKPIYIGSTSNINKREKMHNKKLSYAKHINYHSIYLYDFLKSRINNIKLHIIKKCYNDIVIVGNNTFEYRRNIEEEKLIRHCLEKGIALLNMQYPCDYWMDENSKLYKRFRDKKIINIEDYNINDNLIIDFIKNKKINEPQVIDKDENNYDELLNIDFTKL